MYYEEFFARVEGLVRQAVSVKNIECKEELDRETFHEPLLCLIHESLISEGQQDPKSPGKIRIDMGRPLSHGGLEPNPDAVLVIDFEWLEYAEDVRFFPKYNLAVDLH